VIPTRDSVANPLKTLGRECTVKGVLAVAFNNANEGYCYINFEKGLAKELRRVNFA